MPSTDICRFAWLGTLEYPVARQLQEALVDQVYDGLSPDALLLLEHPHVYTCGRLSKQEHLLPPPEEFTTMGIPVYETDRGGQVTYHGPGQLVCYPIVKVRRWGGGPLNYVRTLERVIVETLADFGIAAHTEDGLTGVWTSKGKIAAIGVKISRGIAFHGFAINVNTQLSYFRHIVPCGITDRPVTSMAEVLEREADFEVVRYSAVYHFGRAMGMKMVEDSTGLPTEATARLSCRQL